MIKSSKTLVSNQKVWIDKKSSLMWQVDVSFETYSWNNSNKYVDKINIEKFGGFDDWRLPTIDELKSLLTGEIINFQRLYYGYQNNPNVSSTGYSYYIKKPLLESTARYNSIGEYWSETSLNGGNDKYWTIGFIDGSMVANYRNKCLHVRCVRDTK